MKQRPRRHRTGHARVERLDRLGPRGGTGSDPSAGGERRRYHYAGVAYLTRANRFSAGIVISASHNPWQDNGIKVFGADGYKLSDQLEHGIEADIFAHLEQLTAGVADAVVLDSGMLPGEQGCVSSMPSGWRTWFVRPT